MSAAIAPTGPTINDNEYILDQLMTQRAWLDGCIERFKVGMTTGAATATGSPISIQVPPGQTPAPTKTTKRKLTPEGRKRIALAQKKRHAAKAKTMAAGAGGGTET